MGAWGSPDSELIHERLVKHLALESYGKAASYLESQAADGSWADIDYEGQTRTNWKPVQHLARLEKMALAQYHDPDAQRLMAIEKGLEYWYQRKLKCPNWWYNDIGQQLYMSTILMLLRDSLSRDLLRQGAGYMRNPDMTGQNRIWLATQTVYRGCLLGKDTDIKLGVNAISREIKITSEEGVQVDGSFHQHGPYLLNGAYGWGYMQDCIRWAWILRGTKFEFPKEKTDVLTHLVLEGNHWMIRRGYRDPTIDGRAITRSHMATRQTSLGALSTLIQLLELNVERQDEIKALKAHIEGQRDDSLVGDKHFWRSDYHCHRTPASLISLRMTSRRTMGPEAINGENTLGYYQCAGLTNLLHEGSEYQRIYPVMDWMLLPGTTTPVKDSPPRFGRAVSGTTDFVGGVTDGATGLCAMDLNWDDVTGKKCWFFTDDGMVAMGAGMAHEHGTSLQTAINQCIGQATLRLARGQDVTSHQEIQQLGLDADWIAHEAFAYIPLGDATVNLTFGEQTGNWKRINQTTSGKTVKEKVFKLWLSHGEQYAYMVTPFEGNALPTPVPQQKIRVLSNTPELQAITHLPSGKVGIVFHQAGTIEIASDLMVTVDHPCLLLVDTQKRQAHVSDPTQSLEQLKVTLSSAHDISLPRGQNAGKSTTFRF